MTQKNALLLHYVQLHALATHFDLWSKPGREKSVKALADFFFQLVKGVGPDLFIEAGAKDARVSRRARRYLETSRIVAFEANPYTFGHFSAKNDNASLSVEYHNVALSDVPGELSFFLQSMRAGEPVAKTAGHHSILKRADVETERTEVSVRATTLDAFFADDTYQTCCIWMDVEGAVGLVLSGAARTLERTAFLMVEVEDRPLWQGQWLCPQVASFLHDAGFIAVARDFQSRYQYNLVFVRDTFLNHDRVCNALAYFYSGIGGHGSKHAP